MGESGGARRRPANRRGAILLLMLLVCVVVGVVYVSFRVGQPSVDRKTRQMQKQSPQDYPWVEQWRIKGLNKSRPWGAGKEPVSGGQVQINRRSGLAGAVTSAGQERGGMSMVIEPDGTIEGKWSAEYEQAEPRSHHMITAGFKGNTDPTKPYSGSDTEKDDRLFVIARGSFFDVDTNYENGKVQRVTGYAYLAGWIDPNLSGSGRIHLTKDMREQRIFDWTGCSGGVPISFPQGGMNMHDLVRQALKPHER